MTLKVHEVESAFAELRLNVLREVDLPANKRHTFDYIHKCRKQILKKLKGIDEK